MGYALFLAIAFVMLAAERFLAFRHSHATRHEGPPTA
jgi:hypothetical protein